MAPTLGSKAIDALGKRLARAPSADPEDLTLLGRLQLEYQLNAQPVGAVLSELVGRPARTSTCTLTVSSRAKTASTIIDKVRRGTRLSTMQDVFGYRVSAGPPPGDFTLRDQDELVGQIVHGFTGARVIDRRLHPSQGYRAVHLVVTVDGFPIEVQVRTYIQDVWANETEVLADMWGRGIRYGLPPDGRTADELAARARVIQANLVVADTLYEWERTVVDLAGDGDAELAKLGVTTKDAASVAIAERVRARMDPVHGKAVAALHDFRRLLELVG